MLATQILVPWRPHKSFKKKKALPENEVMQFPSVEEKELTCPHLCTDTLELNFSFCAISSFYQCLQKSSSSKSFSSVPG